MYKRQCLFLSSRGDAMIRFFILFGYFILTLYLHLSGKLNQYINLHYSYLAYISMVLSLLLAIVQAYVCFKRLKEHSHLHSFSAKLASFALLSLPLLVGFTFPTVKMCIRDSYSAACHRTRYYSKRNLWRNLSYQFFPPSEHQRFSP